MVTHYHRHRHHDAIVIAFIVIIAILIRHGRTSDFCFVYLHSRRRERFLGREASSRGGRADGRKIFILLAITTVYTDDDEDDDDGDARVNCICSKLRVWTFNVRREGEGKPTATTAAVVVADRDDATGTQQSYFAATTVYRDIYTTHAPPPPPPRRWTVIILYRVNFAARAHFILYTLQYKFEFYFLFVQVLRVR